MNRLRFVIFTAACLTACALFIPGTANACNVPVFRYALERWPASPYEVIVFHRDPLTDEQQKTLEWLERSSASEIPYANFVLHKADLSDPSLPLDGLDIPMDNLPWMRVQYPREMLGSRLCWAGAFTKPNAEAWTDSPMRQEIAKRILNGESAVWVFLESGNQEKDEKAATLLKQTLKTLEETLELPDLDGSGLIETDTDSPGGGELRTAFSLLRLSKDDPRERFLVQMLLHSEDDLTDYLAEPMVFPFYGRGRALYAILGAGINEDNIREACEFLTGPCSCLVKEQNPGTDLLIVKNWDEAISESWVGDAEMAQFFDLNAAAETAVADRIVSASETLDTETSPKNKPLKRNLIVVLALIAIVNGFVLWKLLQRKAN